MRKISFFLMILILTSLAGCDKFKEKEKDSGAMSDEAASIAVEVQPVETQSFARKRAYVGNVSASKSVKVIPLTSEQILKYEWENGEYIEKGAVVAEIRNAVSKKGVEALGAQMKSLDAQLGAAQRELKRVQSMYESNIVSRQNYDQAQDAVTTLQASKMQLQASMEQSRMGLDYAQVKAPISGVISQKNSEVGDIASSAMPLCVILQMNPLKVTLNVSEADVVNLQLEQTIDLRFDAYPGEVVTAKVKRIMPYVNTSTRTNVVEAEFNNECLSKVVNVAADANGNAGAAAEGEDEKCLNGNYKYKPGMYVRAEVNLKTTENAIVVPPGALLLDPELLARQTPGETRRKAFIVKDDMTVEAREVLVGEQNGDVVEILSNLKPGEKLVTRGQHSLRNGDKVIIKSSVQSSNKTNNPSNQGTDNTQNNAVADAPVQNDAPVAAENQGAAAEPAAQADPAVAGK